MKPAILFIALTTFLAACNAEQEPILEERIRPVRTAPAIHVPEDIKHRYAGTSQAAATSQLSFRVSGIITEFPAQLGKPLKKGDMIARLDTSDFLIQLEREQAVLAEALIAAENSSSRFKRIEQLFEENVISEVDFEDMRSEYQTNKAEVLQAQRNVQLSKDQLEYTTLVSPADGCEVTDTTAAENENISAGQGIAIISCGSIMEVVSVVPESVVGTLSIGQSVEVLFSALPNKLFLAEVTEIGISTTANGVYTVVARITTEDQRLRPGMAAEMVIARQFDVSKDSVWVPMVAVGEENQQNFVMIYEPIDEHTGTVRQLNVEIGRFELGLVEITQGLTENQLVITAGLSQIKDGLVVRLLNTGL